METRLVVPQLQPFYRWAEPLSWALIRITAGLMLIPHGWPKLMMGVGATANMALVKRGITPAEPLAVILIAIETIGGLCIALGLFTRFWAAAATIEMCGDRLPPPAEIRLDRPRLRISAVVGPHHARHRAAGRRTLLARSEDRARAIIPASRP